jgi:hypothetical protein
MSTTKTKPHSVTILSSRNLSQNGWIGLGWVGLGWIGLDWVELGWVGLDWIGLGWYGTKESTNPEIRSPRDGAPPWRTLEPEPRERLPRKPGGPWAQYIRSGPEGARGVLNSRGWSPHIWPLPGALVGERCEKVGFDSPPDFSHMPLGTRGGRSKQIKEEKTIGFKSKVSSRFFAFRTSP